jgi:phenylacetyl-CoA:acceptor oxidoreductase subunit 1
MTRWAMVADLGRCVGCQTCTAACKHANATAPSILWRKVLDVEVGEFPDVRRTFVPVGCMHCADPPCMHVCPSTATGQRADGIVTIDYDLCIGCAYCAVACPYQARWKIDRPRFAYGSVKMRNEAAREDPRRIGVAQKCTFCSERVDAGLVRGLTPGRDPEATPACVNSCIADALHFGDVEDPQSNVSQLLRQHRNFRMHEEVGTRPGFYYLWEKADGSGGGEREEPADPPVAAAVPLPGVASWHQRHWDWRAAGNFMCGGAGTGFLVFAAVAALFGQPFFPLGLIPLGLVGFGLFLVWLEIGRPWRFINVLFNPHTSWMTREAMAGLPLFASGAAALWFDAAALVAVSAGLGLVFLVCQAQMIRASKGIPAWRQPAAVPLLLATGLTEGGGLFLAVTPAFPDLASLLPWLPLTVLVLMAGRLAAWRAYLAALTAHPAPQGSIRALRAIQLPFVLGGHVLAPALVLLGLLVEPANALFAAGGLLAFAAGWLFKFTLITRAGFNQGFAIEHTPARGAGAGGPGVKPGWTHP